MIETERLLLREYTIDDFDALYEIMSDAELELPYDGVLRASGTRLAPTGAERRLKEMLLVDDVDNREFLCELVQSMWEELPETKKKK